MRGQSCEGAGDKVNPRHHRKGEQGLKVVGGVTKQILTNSSKLNIQSA